MCSTNSPANPTTWRESGQTSTVWAKSSAVHPLTGQEFWEFHPEPRVPPGLSQECQTERSGWPGCSSAAVRPTPSDVLLVVLSSRSEETWFNVSACRNTLDIQSGQQNPTLIWTPNTSFLLLDLMNAAFNSLREARNSKSQNITLKQRSGAGQEEVWHCAEKLQKTTSCSPQTDKTLTDVIHKCYKGK